jgi:hypothetical protein
MSIIIEVKMNDNFFQGKLVRLASQEVQTMGEAFSKWSRDSEYWRLLDSGSVRPFSVKTTKDWIEKNQEKERPVYRVKLAPSLIECIRI